MNGSHLTNYFANQGPAIPYGADQAAIDEALSAYHRIGDDVTITPQPLTAMSLRQHRPSA